MTNPFESAKAEILKETKEVGHNKVKTIALTSLTFVSSNVKDAAGVRIRVKDLETMAEHIGVQVDQTT